jgi:hypothetical protein
MSVLVEELEVVPQAAAPPPGEPTPRAAPDLPASTIEEQVERVIQVREARVERLRAD